MNNKIKAALYSCICVLAAGCIIGGGRYYREHFCGGEARLRGVVRNSGEKQLLLIPESGDAMDTIALKTDGSFDFRFAPAEPFGVYMLYIPDAGIPIYLYARKGARIRVAYDASDIERTPVIRGNVRAECEIIRRMNEEFTGMDIEETARMSFTEYRREIMEEYTVIANLLKQSKDRAFAEATLKELNALRDYHLYAYRASYKLFVSPEDDVPDEAFWEFARTIDLDDAENARKGLTMLVLVWDLQAAGTERSDRNIMEELRRRVSNQEVLDLISEECISSALLNETSPEELEKVYTLFTRTCTDAGMLQETREAYETTVAMLGRFGPGQELLDVEMEDREGRTVHLAELKGKIRYVDIWASWCGPCRYETQFLEQVANRYEGNDRLEIISLSVDTDRDAWLKTAGADRPGWKQYRVTERSRKVIDEDYNITAIPRFMLFDENNRIIDIHAPAPSSATIYDVLQQLLGADESENVIGQ